MNDFLTAPALSLAVLVPVMVICWFIQRRTGNAGIVDLAWSASLGLMAVSYAFLTEGWLPRKILVGALIGIWSARLAWHLYQRIAGEPEDGRYAILREEWGAQFQAKLFWFFQAQALIAVGLSLTYLVLFRAEEQGWRVQDWVAVVLWFISIGGESLADRQLSAWRKSPANRGRTCDRGLWAYSRHPNYFFEWLHWLVYPLLGIGLDWGWALWFAPAFMLFLILKVTGIPPTEKQSIRSRGENYRAYQRTTNAFFPGPRKSSTATAKQTS